MLIGNLVVTAPNIIEEICGGEAQSSGGFTAQKTRELATLLNAGALPAALVIVAEGVGPYAP